jgi:hypothetical protein
MDEAVGDLDRAANALCAWLLEHLDVATCETLGYLHPDTWKEIAEVAIRAGRGERDTRPFTMCPDLPRDLA